MEPEAIRACRYTFYTLFLSFTLIACDDPKGPNEQEVDPDLRIKGSNTQLPMVKRMEEAFEEKNPELEIQVEGGGSVTGIEALIDGETDIATSSRRMRKSEKERAKKAGIEVQRAIVALDALAVISHSRNSIDSLSMKELRRIYSGKVENWKELGGPDQKIVLYGRTEHSGTFGYFRKRVLNGEPYADRMKHLPGNGKILSSVKRTKGAIGYVGIGYIRDDQGRPLEKIWAMPLHLENREAVSPFRIRNERTSSYPLERPLFQYYSAKSKELIERFIRFETSKEGQALVSKSGYFSIEAIHKLINRKNGLTLAKS